MQDLVLTRREEVLRQLSCYVALNTEDDERRVRIAAFVEAESLCCSRTLSVGHLTGSAWVMNESGTHVLLLHHRKLEKWLQPGGHADGDCNLRRVAEREVSEETGVRHLTPALNTIFDLDIHTIPARGDEPAHQHYDLRYAFIAQDGESSLTGNEESNDVRWVALSELENFTREESVLRMRSKWLLRMSPAS